MIYASDNMYKNKPLVSICIPVYNGALTIRETITSIVIQTYKNWELIISDNCSTDDTIDIIKEFDDNRITVYRNDRNYGATYNHIRVMNLAKGKFIKIVCADDLITEDCLEKQVEVFIKDIYKKIAIVTSDIDIINFESKILMNRKIPFKKDIVNFKDVVRYIFLTGRGSIMEPFQILVRRELYVREMQNIDNEFATAAFLVRLLLFGDLFIIRETLGSWRLQKGSLSSQVPQIKQQCEAAKEIHNDKRFNFSFAEYILSCIAAYFSVFLRKIYYFFYAK